MVKEVILKSVVVNQQQQVKEFLPYIHNITYTDETLGESTLDFTMRRGGILPKIGDAIEIQWGYTDNSVPDANTGTLVIDTREAKWGADTTLFSAKAYVGKLKIKSLFEYENQSLRAIVQDKASIANLTLQNPSGITDAIVGTIRKDDNGDDTPPKETFNGTQLQQLAALAKKYAYSFRVKFGSMYFEDLYEIYNKSAIRNYYPPDIIPSPRFRVRIDAAIEAVSVTWQDGNNKRIARTTSTHSITETEVDLTGEGVYGNLDASRRRGFGELMRSYQGTFTGQATVQGDGLLQANEVVNFYNLYSSPFRMVIARATHSFNRNGWRTALDLWRRPSFVDI